MKIIKKNQTFGRNPTVVPGRSLSYKVTKILKYPYISTSNIGVTVGVSRQNPTPALVPNIARRWPPETIVINGVIWEAYKGPKINGLSLG